MSDLPTLREELDRKTLDAIEQLCVNRDSGRISEPEFFVGMDTIWNVTAGLIDDEIKVAVSKMLDSRRPMNVDRHLLINPAQEFVMIERDRHSFDLKVKSSVTYPEGFGKVHQYTFDSLTNPAIESRERLGKLLEALKAKGYQEV